LQALEVHQCGKYVYPFLQLKQKWDEYRFGDKKGLENILAVIQYVSPWARAKEGEKTMSLYGCMCQLEIAYAVPRQTFQLEDQNEQMKDLKRKMGVQDKMSVGRTAVHGMTIQHAAGAKFFGH
jgi:predicted secreted Zn-dependent protease